MLLYSLLSVLVILAWLSTIDSIAYTMNLESIKNTTGAFVIIKAFNALISLAQNIPFLGAIMTPYDDFLDRMSWVMLISLMSLGLQKIIIISVQSFLVNFILSLSLVVLIANKYQAFLSDSATRNALKLFLLLLFIRFSIPLMTLTITSIESSTYEMQTKVSQERVLELQDKLMGIQELLSDDRKAQAKKKKDVDLINEKNSTLEKNIEELEAQIETIKHQAGELFGFSTYSIKSVDQKTKDKIKKIEIQITALSEQLDTNSDKLASLNDIFTFTDTKAKIKTALENLNALMSEIFDVFLTWVIMFFFKNIFFPILFLWLLLKTSDKALNSN
ncbi:MAG: hypothetical protein Q9M40_04520 [Sulfurimonas sp.]|nr:hypothetical protein [Sulfurimonas sp.]